jgi:hypothetical protein
MPKISLRAAAHLEMWNCPCRDNGEWVLPGESCPKCQASLVDILRWFWHKRRTMGLD